MSDDKDRSNLEFQEAVKKHFAFVEDQYKFKLIFADLYTVKYVSEKAYLNIYHERASYELYFRIGILPENYNNLFKADTKDIVAMCCALDKEAFYQASNKEVVNKIVEKLADIAKVYAKNALNASYDFFEDVAHFRKQKQEDTLHMIEIRTAENKANSAWNGKDYKMVVEIYTQFKGQLSPVQQRKLEYAKKRSSHE